MSVTSKLQLKPGQRLAVLRLPSDLELELDGVQLHDEPSSADAVIAFATTAADLATDEAGAVVAAATRDALAWMAYPKAGQLGTDLNRDSLAAALTGRGVRPVRQVAINDVWSALRFRPSPGRGAER